ncbi:UNVERIFIED_CONTAM: hypothetical protein Slati_4198800 [Sesamum latifolium]|uniref:Retrotransposon gag domain-containing protein n=1 Tax=Sesamum latifolium TaxID=2727402 RepID=A0AAW2TB69_9LAMI
MGRREEEAISNRRENVSRTRNDSQRQGATHDPLPFFVAPARKSPFSMQILAEALPQGMRIPSLAEYDGTGDPEDHLEKFLAKADLLDMSDAEYCKIFRTTLSGKVMAWSKKAYGITYSNFWKAVLEVPHLNHELLASILQQGLRRGRFRESIAEKPPTTLDELLKKPAKYIRIEEALKPKVDSSNKRKIREGERKDPRREGGGGEEFEEVESSRRREKGRENLPTAGVIGVVTGGPAGGDSAPARKALVRAASTPQEIDSCKEVIITGVLEEEITFSSNDLEKGVPLHNDALMISATVSNFWVKKVLVDTGSTTDILFFAAFSQMGIGVDMLTKVNSPLVGFNGSVVEPMGKMALPISIGTAPHRATRTLKFLVVDAPSFYNIIMGRPSLNSFRAVASTYHMKLKFPVYRGIGEEKGDRRTARECHANILKKKSKPPV